MVADSLVQALVKKMTGAQGILLGWGVAAETVAAEGSPDWNCQLMWNLEVLWVTGSQRKGSVRWLPVGMRALDFGLPSSQGSCRKN